jgi:hypothetical protein
MVKSEALKGVAIAFYGARWCYDTTPYVHINRVALRRSAAL